MKKLIALILKNWKFVLIGILTVLTILLYLNNKNIKKDRNRLTGDVISINRAFRDKEGKFVSEVSELSLTKKELQLKIKNGDSAIAKLKQEVEIMGVKLKNVQQMGVIHDSIHDTVPVPYFVFKDGRKKFDWNDGYFFLSMISDSLHSKVEYSYKDHLTWAISRYHLDKWRFKNLFVKRPWYYKIDAKYDNPKSVITHQEYVKLTK